MGGQPRGAGPPCGVFSHRPLSHHLLNPGLVIAAMMVTDVPLVAVGLKITVE